MPLIKLISRRPVDTTGDVLPETLHPVLRRIYLARNIRSPQALDYSLAGLLKPDILKGIDAAVQLLADAIHRQKRILVVADFDADGATSCAVAIRALRSMGAHRLDYLVPDRATHGYGLTPAIVQEALHYRPELIVTVDNGISSIRGVERARELGMQVLVTDHHLAGESLPPADAIVNPNQPNDPFSSKALAGVGVIFYVMMALRSHLRETGWFAEQGLPDPNLAELLDLVALGTVADLVPLDNNNRKLVAQGLARINAGECVPGIRALLEISGRQSGRLTTSDLGFFVAPRINAAGRLEDMSLGIECLLSDSLDTAMTLAQQLDRINRERRTIQTDMQAQAAQAVSLLHLADNDLPRALCLYHPDWHQGVVGLVASRIKEQCYRPVIALAPAGNDELKGSARSVPGLHIRDALDAIAARHPDLLQRFGGHAMAAGLTIEARHLEAFRAAFVAEIGRTVSDEDLEQRLMTDGGLAPQDLTIDFAEILRNAGPWGQAFPEPMFSDEFDVLGSRVVGDKHVKMQLRHRGGRQVDAIAFNQAPDGEVPEWRAVRAVYRLDVNEFRGSRSLQLIVEYFEPAGREEEVGRCQPSDQEQVV